MNVQIYRRQNIYSTDLHKIPYKKLLSKKNCVWGLSGSIFKIFDHQVNYSTHVVVCVPTLHKSVLFSVCRPKCFNPDSV